MIFCKNNQMLVQAHKARFQPKLIIQILLFLAVFAVGNAIASVILVIPTMIGIFSDQELLAALTAGDGESSLSASIAASMTIMEKPWIMLISLFATAATTLSCVLYCCKIERRSLSSMGFRKQGWLLRYLKGYAIGTTMPHHPERKRNHGPVMGGM